MSVVRFEYTFHVDSGDDGCTAWIGEADEKATECPLRGYGPTPILALAALCESLKEWPIGGSDRWLATPAGLQLARAFCPEFEPRRIGGEA